MPPTTLSGHSAHSRAAFGSLNNPTQRASGLARGRRSTVSTVSSKRSSFERPDWLLLERCDWLVVCRYPEEVGTCTSLFWPFEYYWYHAKKFVRLKSVKNSWLQQSINSLVLHVTCTCSPHWTWVSTSCEVLTTSHIGKRLKSGVFRLA